MAQLTHHEITFFLLALAVLLGMARLMGELAAKIGQPAIMGEILAGVVLGPTILGRLSPETHQLLFPSTGGGALALAGLTTLAITLFLLVAGLEIDLTTVWRQGRRALTISLAGIVGPFAIGFGVAWYAPLLLGADPSTDQLLFALFMATALSISALPVIAKTLMDLNLFRTDLGMTIIAAAIFDDLAGWIVFAVILAMMASGAATVGFSLTATVALTLAFAAFTLTIGRWVLNWILPWFQAHTSWPGGVLGLVLMLGLTGAAFTEWLGVHAVFGAVMVGVALGDSSHLRKQTRNTLEQFIGFVFAPLFFASLGLHVDFAANFDLLLCLIIFVIATLGKFVGCLGGAYLARMSKREGWAIAFGMNARGAMEMILALLALKAGLIDERLFVALVIMAIATSVLAGPLMLKVLHRPKTVRFVDLISPEGFVGNLVSHTPREAIQELCAAIAPIAGVDQQILVDAVWHREQMMATGLANRVAAPNTRIAGLSRPFAALGLSHRGIDFDAADGQTAQVVCLLLVPEQDSGAQWDILSDITGMISKAQMRERLLQVTGFTELKALFRITQAEEEGLPEAGHHRHGFIFVGANPLARIWARKLVELGSSIWLLDTNRNNVEAAQHEGLQAIAGNATSEVALMAVHAFEAQGLLALTPNAYNNLEIAKIGCSVFAIPESFVASAADQPLPNDRIHRLAVDLESLHSRAVGALREDESAHWVRFAVESGGTLEEFVLGEPGFAPDVLPLVVERGGKTGAVPAWSEMGLEPGDTLYGLKLLTMGSVAPGKAIRGIIDRATILDLAEATNLESLIKRTSELLSARINIGVDELIRLFLKDASFQRAILTKELAIPHLRIEGEGVFEVVVCRAHQGVEVEPGSHPIAFFVLASTLDQSALHLEVLAAIAKLAQRADFVESWTKVQDAVALRAWIHEALETHLISCELPEVPAPPKAPKPR